MTLRPDPLHSRAIEERSLIITTGVITEPIVDVFELSFLFFSVFNVKNCFLFLSSNIVLCVNQIVEPEPSLPC